MLQSKGAAAHKGEARPATQAFVTEPVKPVTIAVGDPTHKDTRRAHDATLVGLAPPPPVHVSSANTQPLALPQEHVFMRPRDDRGLATMLVAGTLIAMFAIAFSAVPERAPAAERTPAAERAAADKVAKPAAAAPAPSPVQDVGKADAAPPRAAAAAPSTPVAEAAIERPVVKPAKAPVARATATRGKLGGKVDTKAPVRRRLAKPTAN